MLNFKKKVSFYLMRTIKSKRIRDFLAQRKSRQINKSKIPKGIGRVFDIDVNHLNEKGYLNLGSFLSSKEIQNIMDKIKTFKCYDPFRKELGMFMSDKIPAEVHVANYRREDLSSVNELLEIANNSDILNVVQDFLGATPTITNINMWWSIPGKERAEQAQLFHRDVDDLKFCKLFIYFTDVDMSNGPHVYVEGSSSSKKLREIRRYNNEEINKAFGEYSIKYFTAPKGSAFIVDTYGFHKGLLPKNKKRLLFQVQYSLSPIGIESYTPIKIENNKYNKYINRLIIK
tara:strand:+ start:166 stop:1026 length:861 start_codon:yes stop_codon:yes gene_type:complete